MVLNSKKGNLGLDGLFIIVVLFAFILTVMLFYPVFSEFNDDLQADPDLDSQAKSIVGDTTSRYTGSFDSLVVLVLGMLWIGAILASFLIDSHPIFFAIAIIILLVVLVSAAIISNTYTEIIGDSTLNDVEDNFPITKWIMEHLVMIICMIAASILIALYGKNRLVT